MGEHLERKRAKQFKHMRDKSIAHLTERDLFSDRPELLTRVYPCVLLPGAQVAIREPLIVVARGAALDVQRGNERIGYVEPDAATDLFPTVLGPGGGHLLVRVHSVQLTGFKIVVGDGEKE